MEQMGICDLHCHVLPQMDDGSNCVEMSLEMLRNAWEQGVRVVFATPHYYPVESVEDFLARRDQAEQILRQAMGDGQYPELILGAEVAYRPGIGYEEGLERLCLGTSRYLLLELPFEPWGQEVLRDINNMSSVHGITPILAHLERYISGQKAQTMRQLLSYDVLAQMNASALLDWRRRPLAKRLIREGAVQLLGSDAHNTTTRPQNTAKGMAALEKYPHWQEQMINLGQYIADQAK